MIRQICTFCECELGRIEEPGRPEERLSHGLCVQCIDKFFYGRGQSLAEFLDTLDIPTLLVNQDRRVLCANSSARRMLNKDADEIIGRLGGEVFACEHADLPGGCGETVHCRTCALRNSITHTAATGEPCVRVPAYRDLGQISDEKDIRFYVSTEKDGEVVLVKIEEAQEPH